MENGSLQGQKDKDTNDGRHDFTFPFIFWSVSDCFHVPNFETGTYYGKERNSRRDIMEAIVGLVPAHHSVPVGNGIEIRPPTIAPEPNSRKEGI